MKIQKMKKAAAAVSERIVDVLKLDRPGRRKPELQQELMALSSGSRLAVRNYYVKKVSVFLAVLITGMILSLAGLAAYMGGSGESRTQTLRRPGYGEGDRREALTVQEEDGKTLRRMEVTVRARTYTAQEEQAMLDRALSALDGQILGENESLDEVRSALCLPQELENGAVRVVWTTVPYGIIREDGSLNSPEDENGTLVELQATLTCGKTEASYRVCARVFPPLLSEQEQFYHALRKEVERADAQESHKETLRLPETVGGRRLVWNRPSQNPFPVLVVMTLLVSVCVYLYMDNAVHKKAEERRNRLTLEYPDLMWKMTMLLGAGLSIRGTFSRIAEEYLREKQTCGQNRRFRIRYACEEAVTACREMESGIPEAQAYERFGRRCQLPEYIRLGSVLSQNLKKGAKGLTALLETEAESSLNDRKHHARKIGEQAGTKLLLPMVLMLGVVLVILMAPAFLSF